MKKSIETRADITKTTVFSWPVQEAIDLLLNSWAGLPVGSKVSFAFNPERVDDCEVEGASLELRITTQERGRAEIQHCVTTGKVQSV
jgi:UDP-N-acetyl-D-mannosaminuronate dehydrogenase